MKKLFCTIAILAATLALPACTSPTASTAASPAPAGAATAATPAPKAMPVALQKVLDDINQFADGAVQDINSPAGQQLLQVVGTGTVNVLADYSSGNTLGAGIAGGAALVGVLNDAAQLPTTSAQLAKVNVAGAKVSGDAAAVAPFVAQIIKAAKAKTSTSVKATAIIQKAAAAVNTVAKVPSAVQQVTSIGNP